MVITNLVDAGASKGIVASAHRSPGLIRHRQLLSQESKTTSQTIFNTTEEELHRFSPYQRFLQGTGLSVRPLRSMASILPELLRRTLTALHNRTVGRFPFLII
ncbi:hypothetical protein ACA910_017660 [Epithemia clementina (nom. ined.)]